MKILACVDSSRYAVSVCDHAAWAARQLALPVELLHVLERHSSNPRIAPDRSGSLGVDSREALLKELVELDEQRNRLAQERGRHLLDEAAAQVRRSGVETITQRLAHGELVDQLHDHEADAQLVVLGKRGDGEDHAERHLGTNLERVIRASHCPAIITSHDFQPIGRFLIAFDGGANGDRAIEFVVQEPLLQGAAGHVLMVGNGSESEKHQLHTAASRLLTAGFEVTTSLRPGNPDDVIPATVVDDGIDLLVMGAYGHSRIRALVIGSTTSTLLRTTTVPLLIIR